MIKETLLNFIVRGRKQQSEIKEIKLEEMDSYSVGSRVSAFLKNKQINMALMYFFNEQLMNEEVDKMEIFVDSVSYNYSTLLNVMLYSGQDKIEEYSVYIEHETKHLTGLDFMLQLLQHEDKEVILYNCKGIRVYEHITELDTHYDYEELIEKYLF